MTVDREWLWKHLLAKERLVLGVYRDPRGFWTMGAGHCVEHIPEICALADAAEHAATLEALKIHETHAHGFLDRDISTAVHDVRAIFGHTLAKISSVRHTALVEMAFMLGMSELAGFGKMRAAIDVEDWDTAAHECLDSATGRLHEAWGSTRWAEIAERLRTNATKPS
jgi:GH24 family phage-related lysozyme (muramidase)